MEKEIKLARIRKNVNFLKSVYNQQKGREKLIETVVDKFCFMETKGVKNLQYR